MGEFASYFQKPQPTQAATAPTPTDPFASYFTPPSSTPEPDPTPQQQGFWNYTFKLLKGMNDIGSLYGSQSRNQNIMPGLAPTPTDPEQQKLAQAVAQGHAVSVDVTLHDYLHIFDQIGHNLKGQLAAVAADPFGFAKTIGSTKGAFNFLGQLALGFEKPIGDMIELSSGVDLTDGNDITALTPEQKADRIKNVAATAALVATGASVGKGIAAVTGDARFAAAMATGGDQLSTEELATSSSLTPKGALARNIAKNFAVGSSSGLVYGAVRNPNDPNQFSQMMTNAIQFGSLGVGLELITGAKGTRSDLRLSRQAGILAQIRKVQDFMGTNIPETIGTSQALASSDNLVQAILDSRLQLGGDDIFHIPGVSSEEANKLMLHIPDGFSVAHHLDTSGETGSLLVYADKYKDAVRPLFFSENGVAKGQLVSLEDGKSQYRVIDGDGDKLQLQDINGFNKYVTVDKNAVRIVPNKMFDKPVTTFTDVVEQIFPKDQADRYLKLKAIVDDFDTTTLKQRSDANDIMHDMEADLPANLQNRLLNLADTKTINTPILDRSTMIDRLYQDWKTNALPERPTSPVELLRTARQNLTNQMENASPAELSGLQDRASRLDSQIKDLSSRQGEETITMDNVPDDIKDLIPSNSREDLPKTIDAYLDARGFTADEKSYIKNTFNNKLANDIFNTNEIESEDKEFLKTHRNDLKADLAINRDITINDVIRSARSNNFELEDDNAGTIKIRDMDSKKVVGTAKSLEDAKNLINKIGQSNGVDLDGGGSMPIPNANGGRGLPPEISDAIVDDDGFAYRHGGKAETVLRWLDSIPWLTRNREFFTSIDTRFKTDIHNKVFEPLQNARAKANAAMRPYFNRLIAIDNLAAKLTAEQRRQIFQYMETMSPDEVIARGRTNRVMNNLEINIGRRLGASDVDLDNVFSYRRQLDRLDKTYSDRATNPKSQAQYIAEVNKFKQQYGIDDAHQAVSDEFGSIISMGKKDADLGLIVRLARSIQNGELSRADFAKKYNLTPTQRTIAGQLDQLYFDLANAYGIPSESRLGGYSTHAKLYTDGNIREALRMFGGDTRAKEFYARMVRTGEISAFETDPIRAMMRYIKAGHDALHFGDDLAKAKNDAVEEIKKLPAGQQRYVTNIINRYISDIQGIPGASDAAAQSSVDHVFDQFGADKAPSVRKSWVNAITAAIPAATQGARMMAGIRDLVTHMEFYHADFGVKRMTRMLQLGGKAMYDGSVDRLVDQGKINVASPIVFSDADEAAMSTLKNATNSVIEAVDATNNALFRLSGQRDVYTLMQAGSYLETLEHTAQQLTKLGRGETTWKQVRSKIKLDTYDEPVAKQFASMVADGKMNEAAEWLATQTTAERIGRFGLANHPYLWGTNVGRLAGQYGNWPVWARSRLTRMISRGTIGQRVAASTRLAASTTAVALAGRQLGLNLSSWNIYKSVGFAGGPLVDLYNTINTATTGYGYEQQSALHTLERMLPINPSTGEIQLKQLYIPGSYFADGLVKAIVSANQGDYGQAAAQAAGFSVLPEQMAP